MNDNGGKLTLRPPDLERCRGEGTLLVWGDIPHWMVVDAEFRELLTQFTSGARPEEVLRARPDWQAQSASILPQLKALSDKNILCSGKVARLSGPDFDPGAPLPVDNVALNLTRACNLRCRFCYNLPYLQTDRNELTAAEISTFLKSTRPFLGKKPSVTVLGGEPLLQSGKLIEVCECARKLGCSALVSTNGLLISEDFAKRARRCALDVQVSLDGPAAAVHDAVRGPGTFDKTLAGVRCLVQHGTHTIVSMVCHAGNLQHLEALLQLALELRVAEARFIPLKRMGGQRQGEFQPVSLPALIRSAAEVLERRPEFLRLLGRDALSILGTVCRLSARRRSCGSALQTILLDADGNLYPCLNCNMPEFKLGNIRDSGFEFKAFWQSAAAVRAHRHATCVELNEYCCECAVRYWCLSGCRGETHVNTGSLKNRAVDCAQQFEAIVEVFWLLAERPRLVPAGIQVDSQK